MLKVEKELRTRLTNHEKDMLNSGFKITDIIWGRFNSENLYVKTPSEFNDYYCNLFDYDHILSNHKDYVRASFIKVQISIIESSGIDLDALEDNKLQYKLPNELYIYGGSLIELHKDITKGNISEQDVDNVFMKTQNFISKRLLPYRYLDASSLRMLMDRLVERTEKDSSYINTLSELLPDENFESTILALIAHGLISKTEDNSDDDLPSVDYMMDHPEIYDGLDSVESSNENTTPRNTSSSVKRNQEKHSKPKEKNIIKQPVINKELSHKKHTILNNSITIFKWLWKIAAFGILICLILNNDTFGPICLATFFYSLIIRIVLGTIKLIKG